MSFFSENFVLNGLGSRGHREVCTSFKSLLKMLSDSGRLSSGHFRWKENNRFIFNPVSSLRSMPSSLPNGSASVEPTPRWPVVGALMGGFTLTDTHSHSLTLTHSLTYLTYLSLSLKKLVTCGVIRSFNYNVFLHLVAKKHGIYIVFWPAPSKNTIYAGFTM